MMEIDEISENNFKLKEGTAHTEYEELVTQSIDIFYSCLPKRRFSHQFRSNIEASLLKCQMRIIEFFFKMTLSIMISISIIKRSKSRQHHNVLLVWINKCKYIGHEMKSMELTQNKKKNSAQMLIKFPRVLTTRI